MKPFLKSIACLVSLASLSVAPLHAQPVKKDIVDTAVAAGSFKTLAAALTAAGLVDALKGEGPFTVFAPTDEAFAKLPAGTVENLLKPENKARLAEILTYRVVAGEITLPKAIEVGKGTTLHGSKVNIRLDGGRVKIGDAYLSTADIRATNGVIHVIDSVLIPSSKPAETPTPSALKAITKLAFEQLLALPDDEAASAALLEITAEALLLTDGVDALARTEIERTLKAARAQTSDKMRRSGMADAVTGTLVRIQQRERRNQFFPFKPPTAAEAQQ